ncbi:MAG: type IV pilus assembly protein PilM [Nitrospira sp.]|nr:type IV pilus assembly protein PilM [Nitrospira sp.]
MFSRPQSHIGLDIGSSTIKLIELEQHAARYRLKRFGVRRLESDVVEEGASHHSHRLKAALRDLLREFELLGSPVAISVSGPSVMVKRIRVSGVEQDALDEYLTWEGHQYIPHAMSDVCFDYWILPPPRPQSVSTETDLLLVAAKQQMVESRKALLEEIGVHPIVCDVDGLALMKTIMRKSPALRGRSFGIANVGASGMNIVFVADEQPLMVRDVSFEGTSSSRAFDNPETVEDTAEYVPGGPGCLENPSAVADVIKEIKCCVESVLERDPGLDVEKLFLCGGQSKHPRLQSELYNALGIPTLPFNPFDDIECQADHQDRDHLTASAHLGGVAVGLALHKDNHG